MHSKLGTKSRLAAHLTALALLILMLVHLTPGDMPRVEPLPPAATPSAVPAAPIVPPAGSLPTSAQPAVVPPGSLVTPTPAVAETVPVTIPVPTVQENISPTGDIAPILSPSSPAIMPTPVPLSDLRPPESTPSPVEPPQTGEPGIEPVPESVLPIEESAPVIPELPAEETPAPGTIEEPITPADISTSSEMPAPPEETPSSPLFEESDATASGDAFAPVDASPSKETEKAALPKAAAETPVAPSGEQPAVQIENPAEPRFEPAEETTTEAPAGSITEIKEVGQEPADAEKQLDPEKTELGEPIQESPAAPSATQPDESGSLVVAESDQGPVAVLAPLPQNANLEVLADGVYWLNSRHNLETDLGAIPEIGTLILLAPVPGYVAQNVSHVRHQVIAADAGDLTTDAAEQFVHLADISPKPIVAAVIPGASGAAFFKGVFLLAKRRLPFNDMLREIEPDLDQAGAAKGEIIHRLRRIDRDGLLGR